MVLLRRLGWDERYWRAHTAGFYYRSITHVVVARGDVIYSIICRCILHFVQHVSLNEAGFRFRNRNRVLYEHRVRFVTFSRVCVDHVGMFLLCSSIV